MFSASRDPLRVKRSEIPNVVTVESTSHIAGTDKVLFVATIYHAAFERRHRIDASRTKGHKERFMHGVFVAIQPDPAHETVRLQPLLRGTKFFVLSKVGFDFVSVRVVTSERGVNLREREMAELRCDLLRAQPGLVPSRNTHHGHPGSGDLGAPAPYCRVAVDQRTDLDGFDYGLIIAT